VRLTPLTDQVAGVVDLADTSTPGRTLHDPARRSSPNQATTRLTLSTFNVGEPGEDLRVVRLWGGQRNPSPPEGDEATVIIASIQTLNSRSGRSELAWIAQSGIVIIDECHHAIAASYTDLLRWLDVQVGSE